MFKHLTYTTSRHYRADIDGLRAVAVVFVLIAHYFPAVLPGGYIGVDIFFVISGFLISSILFRELNKSGKIDFMLFYAKRARRIFPPLTFLLVGAFVCGALFLTPTEFDELSRGGYSGAVFIENLRMARGVDYFDLEIARKPLMHLWSLGVEEQFYLVFPLLALMAYKMLRRKAIYAIAALVLLSFCVSLYYIGVDSSKAYFYPHSRFWQLGVGVLFAWFYTNRSEYKNFDSCLSIVETNASNVSLIAVVALAASGFYFGGVSTEYPGFWGLIPTVAALLLIAAGRDGVVNKALSLKPVVYIGWISYPLYLWHWLFLSVAYSLYSGAIPIGVKIGLSLISLIFAVVSFHLVEYPIRKRPATPKLFAATLCLLLASGGLHVWVHKTDGMPFRLSEEKQRIMEEIVRPELAVVDNSCSSNPWNTCWTDHGLGKADVMFIGNSHSQHLLPAVVENAPVGVTIDLIGHGGTQPLDGYYEGFSEKEVHRGNALNAMLEEAYEASARLVVISTTWAFSSANDRITLKDGSEDTYFKALERTLRKLIESGKHVVLLVDNPAMHSNMDTCLSLRPISIGEGRCSIPKSEYDQVVEKQRKLLETAASAFEGKVYVLMPGYAFCRDGECSMKREDGKPLYTDEHHFTKYGSEIYVREIWRLLSPILYKLELGK